MEKEIMKCDKCGKRFEVAEQGGAMPGSKEPEEIWCPYCRHEVTRRMSNGYFVTHKLPEESDETE